MEVAELAGVEEYQHSTFKPDAEYMEGRIAARAMPGKPHSKLQGFFLRAIYAEAHPLGFEVWPEQRVQTRRDPARYRVPDLSVTFGEPAEDIFQEPPFLAIRNPFA